MYPLPSQDVCSIDMCQYSLSLPSVGQGHEECPQRDAATSCFHGAYPMASLGCS